MKNSAEINGTKVGRRDLGAMLTAGDVAGVVKLCRQNKRWHKYLFSFLYEREEELSLKAAEALGLVAADLADREPEVVRDYLRRLFWSLNDESGGFAPYAPAAIGEIIRNRPELGRDFIPMLFSLWEEEKLRPALLWAGRRLYDSCRDELIKVRHLLPAEVWEKISR